ncbi:MAG TPA: hypothetical protein VFA18_06075 [Gemmataceae bacterium]|nr:hypothetical protein [Gemmataceae bacterium]
MIRPTLSFWFLAAMSTVGLILLLMNSRPENKSPPVGDAGQLEASPPDFDAQLKQSEALAQEMDQFMRELQHGSVSLAEASQRATAAVNAHYPKLLHFVAGIYEGRSDEHTMGHYLVMRAIRTWGPPAQSWNTADLVEQYEKLFQPDVMAQAHLRDYIQQIWPLPDNTSVSSAHRRNP